MHQGREKWVKSHAKLATGTHITAARMIAGEESEEGTEFPTHDPRLTPRDEAIFLLHVAAEIEHALMAQYLYAAFYLDGEGHSDADNALIKKWRKTILGIAKEEMGHLITVQNLLRLIGGPLNLEREDTPFRSNYYPFKFSLEPLHIMVPKNVDDTMTEEEVAECWDCAGSLNRYIAAEMPDIKRVRPEDQDQVRAIIGNTKNVNRVGPLFESLIFLFKEHLAETDFLEGIQPFQATADLWGGRISDFQIHVPAVTNRQEAIAALEQIGRQGEAPLDEDEGEAPPDEQPSHFRRFFEIYQDFEKKRGQDADWTPTYNIPTNPHTRQSVGGPSVPGAITHETARAWAQLFNLRYRLILSFIAHHLLVNGSEEQEAAKRGFLARQAIGIMFELSGITDLLVTLPLTNAASEQRAGPPFELPYTLALPDREADRKHVHLAVIAASDFLIADIQENRSLESVEQTLLENIQKRNTRMTQVFETENYK